MEEENEKFIEKLVGYEKAFTELFRELTLKPAQCDLIRAFLIVSKGKVEFEASFYDLAKVNHKTNGSDYRKLNDNTRYAFKVLEKWQQSNKLTLVELVEKGSRASGHEGKFLYHKSKYKFVLLAEMAQMIANNPENIEAVVKATITQLKQKFVPLEEPKKYQPRWRIRIAKNTIFTKLRKVFQLAIEAGDDPISYCQNILNDGWQILNSMESEYSAYQNSERFIADFESQLNTELMEDNEEGCEVD